MALDLSQTAKRLIRNLAAKSEDGVFYLCYEIGGSEDPDTGRWTPGTKERIPTDGARTNYSLSLIDGTNIKTGDFYLILPFDTPFPTNTQYWFETDTGSYAVINEPEVNHAGQVQIFKPQLRRQ